MASRVVAVLGDLLRLWFNGPGEPDEPTPPGLTLRSWRRLGGTFGGTGLIDWDGSGHRWALTLSDGNEYRAFQNCWFHYPSGKEVHPGWTRNLHRLLCEIRQRIEWGQYPDLEEKALGDSC